MLYAWEHAEQRADIFFPHYKLHADHLKRQTALGVSTGLKELESHIILRLFTNRAGEAGDPRPTHDAPRGGWWREPQVGSKLWLRMNQPMTTDLLEDVRRDVLEALSDLEAQGIVAPQGIDVKVKRVSRRGLGLKIILSQQTAQGVVPRRFEYLWDA